MIQVELFRVRFVGTEAVIDWDSVSGLDLASNPVLLDRWLRSSERLREVRKMRRWAADMKRRVKAL